MTKCKHCGEDIIKKKSIFGDGFWEHGGWGTVECKTTLAEPLEGSEGGEWNGLPRFKK